MSTISQYSGDGTTTQFDITFTYRTTQTVNASVDGVAASFTFINPSRIEFDTAPADGSEIRIYRQTDVSAPDVDFQDGAIVLADDLDNAVAQVRDRTEELDSDYSDLSARAVRVTAGDPSLTLPAQATRADQYLAFDSNGDPIAIPGSPEEALLRIQLAENGGSGRVVYTNPEIAGAVPEFLNRKLDEIRTLRDFGAVGYNTFGAAQAGTDSTAAVQAAFDWLYDNGAIRAIDLGEGFFKVSNVTIPPYSTIFGRGRQASGFVAAPGTVGKMFTADVSSQKIILKDFVISGMDEPLVTHALDLTLGQHGTEGYLEGLWLRNVPDGHGLEIDGNVSYVRLCTFESCKFPFEGRGTGNKADTITVMQGGQDATTPSESRSLSIAGWSMKNVHIEAPASTSIPISIYRGDSSIDGLTLSPGVGSTFPVIIEADDVNYPYWSIDNVVIYSPGNITIGESGLLRYGNPDTASWTYTLGTDPSKLSGLTLKNSLRVRSGRFELKGGNALQGLSIRITKTGGVIKHRITSPTAGVAGNYTGKITGANAALQNTPTGSSAPAFGGAITASGNQFVLDVAPQLEANGLQLANVAYNSTGTALAVWPYVSASTLGGVSQKRLTLEFRDAATGAAFSLTGMTEGAILEIQVLGFIA